MAVKSADWYYECFVELFSAGRYDRNRHKGIFDEYMTEYPMDARTDDINLARSIYERIYYRTSTSFPKKTYDEYGILTSVQFYYIDHDDGFLDTDLTAIQTTIRDDLKELVNTKIRKALMMEFLKYDITPDTAQLILEQNLSAYKSKHPEFKNVRIETTTHLGHLHTMFYRHD